MQTVITAAGETLPELLSGAQQVPKPLIQVGGRNVISRAIDSYVVEQSSLNVVIREQDAANWNLDEKISLAHPQARIIKVNDKTRGALVSALLAVADLELDEALVVAAGDSEISVDIAPIVSSFRRDDLDAGTIVFRGEGHRWSYVSVNALNEVVEVSEKYQLGNLATIGFFYFKSVHQFLSAAKWVLVNNAAVGGQFYVSSAVNHIISSGSRVGFQEIPGDSYRPWSRKSDFENAKVSL